MCLLLLLNIYRTLHFGGSSLARLPEFIILLKTTPRVGTDVVWSLLLHSNSNGTDRGSIDQIPF